MMPPTSIDGTDITGATIDGTDVQEITVDGDTVFTAEPTLPAQGDLYLNYDARNITNINTFPDTQSGFDLTASGSPTLLTSGIGGQQTVEYAVGNKHETTSLTTKSQPITVGAVFEFDSFPDATNPVYSSDTSNLSNNFRFREINGEWGIRATASLNGGTTDFDPHASVSVFDSTNSLIELDGTNIASGNAGGDGLSNTFTFGASGARDTASKIAQVVVYTKRLNSTERSDLFEFFNFHYGTPF